MRLGLGWNVTTPFNFVFVVGFQDHIPLADFGCPPTHMRHAIFERARFEIIFFPVTNQGVNVFGLEVMGSQAMKSERKKVICHLLEGDESFMLRAVGTIAVPQAHLLEIEI